MAKLAFKPAPRDNKDEALEFLAAYKKQNPVKYEAKKAALFKFFGLELEAEKEEVKDESDKELEVIKEKVAKTKKDAK